MKYYKFRSLNNLSWLADILINKRLYCSPVNNLNDPMEGLFQANIKNEGLSTIEIVENPMRICSFSTTLEEILLWSHYADDHRGIAVEFAPSKQPERVKYSNELYTMGSDQCNRENASIRNIHLTKLKQWEYEKEYRYLTQVKDEEFLKGSVTKVYFGIRTPEAVKQLIKSFCDHSRIETVETKLDSKKYRIQIK